MSTVIRSPNWIGDGVMCLPAIRACKSFFPDERLSVAAKEYLAGIFLNIPEIDEIIVLPASRSGLAGAGMLRQQCFTRGILFTNSFSSALLFRLAGVPALAGYARDGRGFLLHDRVPLPASRGHQQHDYLNIVAHVAGREAKEPFDTRLVVAAAERSWTDAWLQERGVAPGQPLLALSPTAAYGSAKAWLPERFHDFARSWNAVHPDVALLFFGAAAEKERIAALTTGLPGLVLNLAGCLELRRSIAVLSRCRLFVGNDSGLMHIAAALSVPLVAIFGPTEPGSTAPLAERFRLLHHGVDCAPCRHRDCPSDHRCMAAVGVDEVLEAASEIWPGGR